MKRYTTFGFGYIMSAAAKLLWWDTFNIFPRLASVKTVASTIAKGVEHLGDGLAYESFRFRFGPP
jgi:hypothetical protein